MFAVCHMHFCSPSSFNSPAAPCATGVSDRAACHDRRLSVARWVTPYGREAHWFSGNTAALPLLSSVEAVAGPEDPGGWRGDWSQLVLNTV